MVQISHETLEAADDRLRKVIAKADLKIYAGFFAFEEFPMETFKSNVREDALALVRDNKVWSQLVPSSDKSLELFSVFSFHFDDCADNSGFVGWLASYLKMKLGTGVFVTCGQNTKRGGIFDYWGCPPEIKESVLEELHCLRGGKLN